MEPRPSADDSFDPLDHRGSLSIPLLPISEETPRDLQSRKQTDHEGETGDDPLSLTAKHRRSFHSQSENSHAAALKRREAWQKALDAKCNAVQLPVFMDLTEDRTRVRFLGVAILLLVVSIIGALVLAPAFKNSTKDSSSNFISVAFIPTDPIVFGDQLQFPIKARIKTSKSYPNTGVTVGLQLINIDPVGKASVYCSHLGKKNLYSYQLDSICLPEVNGAVAVTDNDGVATFDQFSITSGPPGLYRFFVSCVDTTCLGESTFSVRMLSKVQTLRIYNDAAMKAWHPKYFQTGVPLPITPQVQVLDINGNPLPNKVIKAAGLPDVAQFGPFLKLWPSVNDAYSASRPDQGSTLSGSRVVTDSNGVASFDSLTVAGYSHHTVSLVFECEGRLTFMENVPLYDPSSTRFSNVPLLQPVPKPVDVNVTVVSTVPAAVMEKKPLPVTVLVTNAAGAPLANKFVFATVSEFEHVPLSAINSQVLSTYYKTFINSVSTSTDADGRVTLSSLAFTTHGRVGVYGISFVCEGVASPIYHVNVTTSVVSLRVITPVNWQPVTNSSDYKALAFSLAPDTSNLPFTQLLDADGNGVSGKEVIYFDDLGNAEIISYNMGLSDENGYSFMANATLLPKINSSRYIKNQYQGAEFFSVYVRPAAVVDGSVVGKYELLNVLNLQLTLRKIYSTRIFAGQPESQWLPMLSAYIDIISFPRTYISSIDPLIATIRVFNAFGEPQPGATVCPHAADLLAPTTNVFRPDVFVNFPRNCRVSDDHGFIHFNITAPSDAATRGAFNRGDYQRFKVSFKTQNPTPSRADRRFLFYSDLVSNGAWPPDAKSTDTIVTVGPAARKLSIIGINKQGNIPAAKPGHIYQITTQLSGFSGFTPTVALLVRLTPPYVQQGTTTAFQPLNAVIVNDTPLRNADSSGRTVFNMSVIPCCPGKYGFIALELKSGVTSEYTFLEYSNPVASIEPVVVWSFTHVPIATIFPTQPVLRIVDANGKPLQGYQLVAVVTSDSTKALLVGATSLPSDENGMANFTSLAIAVADASTVVNISFSFADGLLVSEQYPSLQTTAGSGVSMRFEAGHMPPPSASVGTKLLRSVKIRIDIEVGYGATGIRTNASSLPPLTAVAYRVDPDTLLPDRASPVPGLEGNVATPVFVSSTATAEYEVTYDSLTFTSAPTGLYALVFNVPGASLTSSIISLDSIVGSVEIVKQPIDAQVGGLTRVHVVVRNPIGEPMSGKEVRLEVASAPPNSNVVLDPSYTTSYTDGNGMAFMIMRFVSARPGKYRIKFTTGDTSSQNSNLFEMFNQVKNVEILDQPGGPDVIVAEDPSSSIASMQQPRIRVTDHSGHPFTLIPVGAQLYQDGTRLPGDLLYDFQVHTDVNGIAQFSNMFLAQSVNTGYYYIRFNSLGIESEPSRVFFVTNLQQPDLAKIEAFKNTVYVCMLFFVPLFLSTSTWHQWRWMAVGLVVAVAYTAIISGYLSATLSKNDDVNPYSFTLRLFALLNFCAVCVGYLYYFGRSAINKWGPKELYWKQYIDYRRCCYEDTARRLLREENDFDRELLLAEALKPKLRHQIMDEQCSWIGALRVFFCGPRPRKDVNYHLHFEGSRDFFYPSRILFACALSVTLMMFGLFGCVLLFQWVANLVQKARVIILDASFAANRVLAPASGAAGAASAVSQKSVSVDSIVSGSGNQFVAISAFVLQTLGSIDGALVDEIAKAINVAGSLAVVVGFIFVSISWLLMIKHYRTDMFAVRQGDYSRLCRKRKNRVKFSPVSGASLVGLMIWRSFFAFVVVVLCWAVVFFLLQWAWFWAFLFQRAQGLVISLLSLSVAVAAFKSIVAHTSVAPTFVRHRKFFEVYQFVVLFMGFASGFLTGLAHFAMATSSLLLRFPRVDVENFPNDGGYDAYCSALLLDHDFNSPACQLATDVLASRLHKSPSVRTFSDADLKRPNLTAARARLSTLYTLVNNPALRKRPTNFDDTSFYRKANPSGQQGCVVSESKSFE